MEHQEDLQTNMDNDGEKHDSIIDSLKLDCGTLSPDAATEYLTEQLLSMGVGRLSLESSRLHGMRSDTIDATQELAFSHYNSFIHTSDTIEDIKTDLSRIQDESELLNSNIATFCDSLVTFADDAKDISKRWRTTSKMLSKHSSLVELLEMPQLMENCVKNNNYEEAVKLYDCVSRIKSKYAHHNPDVQLLMDVSGDMEKMKESLIQQLLKELKENLQLPSCLKIISYLRRLQKYSETELKIKFLTIRNSYIEQLISDVPKTPPVFHLMKIIEVNRINLFDVTTQFRAVFSSGSHDPLDFGKLAADHHPRQDFSEASILTSWFIFRINQFLDILQSDLTACIESDPYYAFDSIIDPSFYFGLSMSRIGADIRPRLAVIFTEMSLRRFKMTVDKATVGFESSIGPCLKLENMRMILKTTRDDETSVSALTPPKPLLDYPCLASYLNGIITSFNEIRLVIPVNQSPAVSDILNDSLKRAAGAIITYFKTVGDGITSKNHMMDFTSQFFLCLIPHVETCFNSLFPPATIAKGLGLSLLEYNRLLSLISSDGLSFYTGVDSHGLKQLLKDYLSHDDSGVTTVEPDEEPLDEQKSHGTQS